MKMWLPNVGLMLLWHFSMIPTSDCFCCWYIEGLTTEVRELKNHVLQISESQKITERQIATDMNTKLDALIKQVSASSSLEVEIYKIGERLSNTLSLISQRDERNQQQILKTNDDLTNLSTRLIEFLSCINKTVTTVQERLEATPSLETNKVSSDIKKELNKIEARLVHEAEIIKSDIDALTIKAKGEAAIHTDTIQTVFAKVRDIGARIGDIEFVLDVLKKDLIKTRENPKEPLVDVKPAIEEQTSMLNRVKELLEDTSKRIRELPKVSEVQTLHNETRMFLQETKHSLENVIQLGIDGVGNKVSENKEERKYTCSALRLDFANNAERLNKALVNIEKGQTATLSVEHNVLETKQKVENGVQQILLEVDALIKTQGNSLNNALTEKFSNITNDLTNSQQVCCFANVTSKLERDISEVGKQLNLIHKKVTPAAVGDAYVN